MVENRSYSPYFKAPPLLNFNKIANLTFPKYHISYMVYEKFDFG